MRKIPFAAIVILSFALLTCLAGCGRKRVDVKANAEVRTLVKSWGSKIAFYTPKDNPLKTIEGLNQAEVACWGPELSGQIRAFYVAAGAKGANGNAVRVIPLRRFSFSGENAPRLFLTYTNNEPKLKNAVKVDFPE